MNGIQTFLIYKVFSNKFKVDKSYKLRDIEDEIFK